MHTEVPIVNVATKEDFMTKVYIKRRPAVLKGIELGSAPSLWTPDYLCRKCGERAVKVHVTPVPRMDFIRKNFIYRYAIFHPLAAVLVTLFQGLCHLMNSFGAPIDRSKNNILFAQ